MVRLLGSLGSAASAPSTDKHECFTRIEDFQTMRGVFLQGSVSPAIEGVAIVVDGSISGVAMRTVCLFVK